MIDPSFSILSAQGINLVGTTLKATPRPSQTPPTRPITQISGILPNGLTSKRILLKPVLGDAASIAYTDHDQTQLSRVYYFLFFGVFLASKGFNYSELIHLK